MKKLLITFLAVLNLGLKAHGQACGVAQSLSSLQQAQISTLLSPLDTALKYEDLQDIDSLSTALKAIYSTQAGLPDAAESYFTLTSNTLWLTEPNALLLSRALIADDSMVYVDLWKSGQGLKPPLYQPHSLFLRASAEIASGLLKIADKETDATRKSLYQAWATRALDSLATMQLPNGAFPFPDLRTYGDPVFSPIIQNFLIQCGDDSVNVLQGGWIIDDKETGEFKFDAGVIANAYYEAYLYTGNIQYKNITIAIGDYLKPLKFNRNYNYNTFVSLGLTRAYQLTNDITYLDRAMANLRYAVSPGQIINGRWMDGHNANSRYHNLMIQNIVPTVSLIPSTYSHKATLDSMIYLAVKNITNYSYTCHASTGYRWLIKTFGLNASIIPSGLKDSLSNLLGQHINQSALNGKFLDVPTMGEYLELLDPLTALKEASQHADIATTIYPNPSRGMIHFSYTLSETESITLALFDAYGRELLSLDEGSKSPGTYMHSIDLSKYPGATYWIRLRTAKQNYTHQIIRTE